jgi:hypothetical protein
MPGASSAQSGKKPENTVFDALNQFSLMHSSRPFCLSEACPISEGEMLCDYTTGSGLCTF